MLAALPTEDIVKAENINGSMPPMNKPATTGASRMLIPSFVMPAVSANETNNDNAVRAAEPMAKPLPIAAVVLPTASNLSVISLTLSSSSDISAIPPALSAIGP